MDENLVGYLLKCLDADEHREVEDHLRGHPEARQRLELLRRSVAPLAADAEIDPPPGLWVGALARLAEYQCRSLPAAPKPSPAQVAPPGRPWWRRADVLVAAAAALFVLGLSLPWVGRLWYDYRVAACKHNLHNFHNALMAYADLHDGALPQVGAREPAGIYVPILNDAQLLPADVSVTCPGKEKPRPPYRISVRDLEERKANPDEFEKLARELSCCYAYSLGYFEPAAAGRPERLVGLRRDSGDELPVLADCPPPVGVGNSPNHNGRGQNVLYLGGNVRFQKDRTAGVAGDDIYLNWQNRVAAGRDRTDTVLGSSAARPYPVGDE